MRSALIAVSAAALGFAVVGCGSGDPNIATLQGIIMGQGPQWTAADKANGNPDTETVDSASCLSTGNNSYSCNASFTVTGGYNPGKFQVTIPGTCDSSGTCQTGVSGPPVRSGN
jgi:hypothetical protein